MKKKFHPRPEPVGLDLQAQMPQTPMGQHTMATSVVLENCHKKVFEHCLLQLRNGLCRVKKSSKN